MKIALVYVFPQVELRRYHPLAQRFAQTYSQFRPNIPHEFHVFLNGGDNGPHSRKVFNGIDCVFHQYNNAGWDIGAFQWAANNLPCDMMVCLGAPVHFHKPKWLELMSEAYIEHGLALFGCWAYLSPNWHVRTTCFWMHPEILKTYPLFINSLQRSRYEFEHGTNSFTRHVLNAGLDCIMVTRNGCFPFSEWLSHAPGVENSLVLDQHVHR